MKFGDYVKVKSLQTPAGFRENLQRMGLPMPCDDVLESGTGAPLAAPLTIDGLTIGNRFAIHPMEGWDALEDGRPSDNTRRRWQRFGASGAKLIWGGEAVAVRPDGRANPNQLMLNDQTQGEIGAMRESLVAAHREVMGGDQGLVVGLQLTHSGRFCKPNDHHKQEPMILYRHPILDRKFKLKSDHPVMSDGDIRQLIDQYVAVAKRAAALGFDFVDLKACHGYLGHEFLSAKTRPGEFGGSLENRTRFLREIVAGVRAEAPGLKIGLRISAIDSVPFRPDPALSGPEGLGPGTPEEFVLPYRYGFGHDENNPLQIDLTETKAVIGLARDLGIKLFNITLGSPYYNPHLTRPALYPPSDGYHPPEDPLIGVMRHLNVVREIKQSFPDVALVGSGYTYLQEFLPHVAQATVRAGWTDLVGLGRMVLSYPELPADVLSGKVMQRKRLCRTFSDCTTAPRHGLVSGCYPLDAHYKKSPEMVKVTAIKKAANIS
ncbi:MAG: NADH:flavin oxidoreductase [Burkholderiales bacterium]|jgi:2,4-dienoyl-CoA reductase-like NADH-dependent reductase (Old Yellow Enzyme family)|nr:NADH:flavin oxidoreductase [Burkholderiales bacterium]